jgi:hypothetical protein
VRLPVIAQSSNPPSVIVQFFEAVKILCPTIPDSPFAIHPPYLVLFALGPTVQKLTALIGDCADQLDKS